MSPGDIISYLEMCTVEKVNLQRGMNFHLRGNYSVILMSLRQGAPYADRIEEDGNILVYEGHDIPKTKGISDPKKIDQQMRTPNGTLTQNGLFFEAATNYKKNRSEPERVKVYEKIRPGIWVFNGFFKLVDAREETSNNRKVFKFRLEVIDEEISSGTKTFDIEHTRLIPTSVKLAVWKRDNGCCTKCGSNNNLHFDHIIPFSKGGSSLVAKNIQLLCARHNLAKRAEIE